MKKCTKCNIEILDGTSEFNHGLCLDCSKGGITFNRFLSCFGFALRLVLGSIGAALGYGIFGITGLIIGFLLGFFIPEVI